MCKTHRCENSLKYKVSIRFCNPHKWSKDTEQWWLLKSESDSEWDCYHLNPISPIEFCPYCGIKLDKE